MSEQPSSRPAGRPWIGMTAGLLVLAILAGVAWIFMKRTNRPDFSAVGGVILLYEVEEQKPETPSAEAELVEALQRRLDGAGLAHVFVRPAGKGHVEIL